MAQRVLITGAGGFMGSHVLRHFLLQTDWELILLDSFRHRGKTDRITQQLEGLGAAVERITVMTHDLRAPFSRQMTEKLGNIDYLVSIASESHVDRSIEEPRDFIENNVELMLTLLEYARSNPVGKFLHISTDEVYGPAPNGYKHTEGEPHRPSNPYSASKAAQEDICYAYWRTFGVPVIITNTMNIIGEMQDPEKFIPMVIQKVKNGASVPIHASKDGQTIGSRFYLHARNQADALRFILTSVEPEVYGGNVRDLTRFNIVGEKEVTNLELARSIAACMGKQLQYNLVDFHSSRPGHDLRYALDGTKLQKTGWRAPYAFEESLQKTVRWEVEHPQWLM